ncbi:uncharacterized protein LOC126901439 [Daktulosphaira vitifoliae]|uniref:uncharacterized protein LOC126901439 n=1 Tax=Daktulosphaira vitifoliae TaxID=58002 RepID=UPI0021A983DD|nr:uncharacterized protein LOC126901439 [Daktulosphaira vitifoliae]
MFLKLYFVFTLLFLTEVFGDSVNPSNLHASCIKNYSPGVCLIKNLLKNVYIYLSQSNEANKDVKVSENATKEPKGIENYIISQMQKVFSLFSFGLELPEIPWSLLKVSFLDSRGKKNKNLGPMIAAGAAVMFGTLMPLAFGALFMLAGKAIMTSMLAITISGLLGLKSLFSKQEGHYKAYMSVPAPVAGHYSEQYEQEELYKGQTEAKMHSGFYAGENSALQSAAGYYKREQQSNGSEVNPDYYGINVNYEKPKHISNSSNKNNEIVP